MGVLKYGGAAAMHNCENKKGFTLVEIFLACAIMAILIAIAVPNFIKARSTVQANTCVDNLRQLKLAKDQWALENNKVSTDTPSAADLNTYIRNNTSSLTCPLDTASSFATSYNINNVGTDPGCTIDNVNHHL